MDNYEQCTIDELIAAYKNKETTPTKVVEQALAVIAAKDEETQAFLEVLQDHALKEAAKATALYEKGEATAPLQGVPFALKNNILKAGIKTTAGSKILENYTATYTATVVGRLEEAGAICIGTTNLDEFAMGSSTENSAFQVTKNPADSTRVPGGSSGGSAAAVAMGAVPFAIGTDTGGSIRQPASYCGVYGYKPTYGAVSRYGLMAMGSSLDQAGPFARSAADVALVHTIMAGVDPYDATTIADDTYEQVEEKTTYTIGVPRHMLKQGVDEDVLEQFEGYIKTLEDLGHTVVDIELPLFEQGLAAYYIVMPAEVSSNLARYDGIRYGLSESGETLLDVYKNTRAKGFGAEVKRRILLGTYVLSSGYYDAYYGKAEALRHLMREELAAQFKKVDLIMTPTAPTPAFKIGEKSDPLSMYAQDIFTVPVNLAGIPAMSIPALTVLRDGKKLPCGIQCMAAHAGDGRLLAFSESISATL